MTSAFTLLRSRCGMSQRETAMFLNVRIDTVKSWDAGRNNAPAGAITELRTLYKHIKAAADRAIKIILDAAPDGVQIELGLAADDHEAKQLGLPCVGAHEALLGLVAALVVQPVRIVPRGSTIATAAAIEAHEPY